MDKSKWGVHEGHCCVKHGCKYGDEDCPVALGLTKQSYICESCSWDGLSSLDDLDKVISLEQQLLLTEGTKNIIVDKDLLKKIMYGDHLEYVKVEDIVFNPQQIELLKQVKEHKISNNKDYGVYAEYFDIFRKQIREGKDKVFNTVEYMVTYEDIENLILLFKNNEVDKVMDKI